MLSFREKDAYGKVKSYAMVYHSSIVFNVFDGRLLGSN